MAEIHSWLFRYGQHAIRLRLPESWTDVFHFLQLYFVPFFEILPDDPLSQVAADIHLNPSVPREVPDLSAGKRIVVDGSKGFLAMEGRSLDLDSGRWVALEPSCVIVQVVVGRRMVRIFAPPEVDARIPVLRVIEDVILNAVQNAGRIVLHASAVVAEGAAVIAVGNKMSGKTSFLCESLSAFATEKLANDNVCVAMDRSKIIIRGWPSFFKANVGTVLSHEALVEACPDSAVPLLDDDQAIWRIYEKVSLFPAEAAAKFGSSVLPEAELGMVVLPQFSANGPVDLTYTSPRELHTEFAAYLQGIHNPNHPEWLSLNPVNEGDVAAGLNRFIGLLEELQIPVVRLRWAPGLGDLLRRLPPLRRVDRLLGRARRAKIPRSEWPRL